MQIAIGVGLGQMQRGPSGPLYGPELVANPGGPFISATGWTGAGATVTLTDGELVVTALDGSADRAECTLSGLTIGAVYRTVFVVRRVSGSSTSAISWTWCTVTPTIFAGTADETYTLDLTATATTGISRFYCAQISGAPGDTIVIKSFSVRQVL